MSKVLSNSNNKNCMPNLDDISPEESKKLQKRQKNNVAVKKCRIKRKQKEEETKQVVVKLREVNEKMEAEFVRAMAEKELLNIILPFCRFGNINQISKRCERASTTSSISTL